ncbi:MAG: hypothetical protein V2I36_07475 [Desulfopila sp.]|jgi:hypothetical protein|nr:hypothetical protein [Desulfopila sp.]
MKKSSGRLFFDKNDHQLLDIVDDILERGSRSQTLRSLLSEHMHPQGIKEMAAPRGLRIAYAIASLLGSFEKGRASDRIKALRSLRDEVSLSSTTFYRKNTARVLLQIMKDLLRCKENTMQRLKLAHDFRMVSTGNPRRVRAELAKYHLLEMPEEWNQYSFDNHVHDANTKGRKTPTHLIMDAWIKGIKYLTVVYYNYVKPEVVEELLEAGSILDVQVQVGIEMSARFREKYIRFTWQPQGLNDNRSFVKFLKEKGVMQLMNEGRLVSEYQQKYVFAVFNLFNRKHRQTINDRLQIALEPLHLDDFIRFVGSGQPSLLHLAKFIYNSISARLRLEMSGSGTRVPERRKRQRPQTEERFAQLRHLNIETIIGQYLHPGKNPELHDPSCPQDSPDVPDLLKLTPRNLLARLLSRHASSTFTLNLSNLSIQDTMEILYSCEGMISHIESYNLKDAAHGITSSLPAGGISFDGQTVDLQSPEKHYSLISKLQQALNDDNVIGLKRVIREIIWDYEDQHHRMIKNAELIQDKNRESPELQEDLKQMLKRKTELMDILYNLEEFHNYYKNRTLGSHIGSGSAGQSDHQHGMGLVVVDTLPDRARKTVKMEVARQKRVLIPVTADLTKSSHSRSLDTFELDEKITFLGRSPFFSSKPYQRLQTWSLNSFLVHPKVPGNIATLGGLGANGDSLHPCLQSEGPEHLDQPWKYLNTNLKNSLKVVIGFIPAFITFYLTKDWWLLAYFGAFIWFAITGSRNIIQSVLGGGGLRRSSLLPWNSLVSWSRIADSLLYTGFSVPLLDFLVKTVLMDQTFGVTTTNNPILLYGVMGLANGMYISGHNAFRGLPKSAVVGNFFRSVLAIPLAVVLNSLIGSFLTVAGAVAVNDILQKWAAIISKFASDCVAAIIEGLADRQTNIRARLAGYRLKLSQLFAVFSRLDLLFPEEDVLDILQSPKVVMETLNYEAREQERYLIVNALDLMYFWMYQPRARKAMEIIFEKMSREEWLIFYRSQLVLKRHREISQVFVDGLVGKNFSKALSFYLDRAEEYLRDLEKLGLTKKWL